MYRIEPATPGQLETVRGLFREYQSDIGIDLCFQNFERKRQSKSIYTGRVSSVEVER